MCRLFVTGAGLPRLAPAAGGRWWPLAALVDAAVGGKRVQAVVMRLADHVDG